MENILYIYWNISPYILKFGSFTLGYYNLLFVGGIVISSYIINRLFKKEGISDALFTKLFLYCFVGIVAGARLGHCLFYEPEYFLAHPLEMILPISFRNGSFSFGYRGLASHGGAIGLLIAIFLYCRQTKSPVLKTLDYIGVVAPLGGMCIRIGNFMNSEIIGDVTDVPWAVVFERVDMNPRHPAQLYEALAYLVIFIILFTLYKYRRSEFKSGFFFGSSIFLIFISRFCIEFIKEAQESFENYMALDMGQLLSIPFIVVGLYLIIAKKTVKSK